MKKIYLVILLIGSAITVEAQSEPETLALTEGIDWEVFPIVTYDTDAGFGYGIKGYIRNPLAGNESYDLTLYNSTEGERWYRLQFSFPDYEARHGTDYGYALDLTADYDKWISYYFYGIGISSSYDNQKLFTREPLEFNIILNKTLTEDVILQAGIRYKTIKYTNFPDSSLPAGYSYISKADRLSLMIQGSYDSRNSIINPVSGTAVTAGIEFSPGYTFTNSSFAEARLTFQTYIQFIFPELVFAGRLDIQQLIGQNIPVQFLLPIGGNLTLRGYSQDRFLDKGSALINAELRFPIWWRFGGIAGIDAGRVFPSPSEFSFGSWKISPAAGLRFYMNNFVVRADFGFSSETVGFYFNFGHLF
ncbi:MAG TPA: BamA/TamA family outer membrane protein [Ignavibacteriaceae bacterium]|nr:BamA/TamA family outer membrane protein [Ignavibacteriaceae bacterium]